MPEKSHAQNILDIIKDKTIDQKPDDIGVIQDDTKKVAEAIELLDKVEKEAKKNSEETTEEVAVTEVSKEEFEKKVEEAEEGMKERTEKAKTTLSEFINYKIKQCIDIMGFVLTKQNPFIDNPNNDPDIKKKNDDIMSMISKKINYWVSRIVSQRTAASMIRMSDEICQHWFKEGKPFFIEEMEKMEKAVESNKNQPETELAEVKSLE